MNKIYLLTACFGLLIIVYAGKASAIICNFRAQPHAFSGKLSFQGTGSRPSLTLDLTALTSDFEDVDIVFRLPKGVIPLGETEFKHQRLVKGDHYQYRAEVIVKGFGVYILQASVYYTMPGISSAQHFHTYLSVIESGFLVSDEPLLVKSEALTKRLRSRISLAPGGEPLNFINLRGQIKYFDDNLRVEIPIRRVEVSLWEANHLTSDIKLSSTFTDVNGNYAFENLDNTDVEDGTGRDIYVIVSFENSMLNLATEAGATYRFQSSTMTNVAGGELRIDYSLSSSHPQRPAGHIFNSIQDESDFLMRQVGFQRGQIQVKWPVGKEGAAFASGYFGDEFIIISPEHQWNRGAMLHEYGHAVMYTAYKNNFPKTSVEGEHYIFTVSDAGFALIEGWAEFMETVVDDNAFNVVGMLGRNVPNIETNDWWRGDMWGRGSNAKGEIVEGSVASILWDAADTQKSYDETPNVDDDNIGNTFPQIWQILAQDAPQSVVDIWRGWIARNFSSTEAIRDIYFDHGIVLPLPPSASTTRTIAISQDLSGSPNQRGLKVPITVDELSNVASGEITILYDFNLISAVNVEKTELLANFGLNFNLSLGKIAISLTPLSTIGGEVGGSGAIMEITFDIKPDAEIGRVSGLVFETASLHDGNGSPISLMTKNGSFTINGLPGDLTRDGTVDAADAILLLRIFIGKLTPGAYQKSVGDVNGDGEINATDAVLILKEDVGLAMIPPD